MSCCSPGASSAPVFRFGLHRDGALVLVTCDSCARSCQVDRAPSTPEEESVSSRWTRPRRGSTVPDGMIGGRGMRSTVLAAALTGLCGVWGSVANAVADEEQRTEEHPADVRTLANEAAETQAPRTAEAMNADAEALTEALWSAAADGDIERFNRLLAMGAEIDATQAETVTTALWIASQEGHTEM